MFSTGRYGIETDRLEGLYNRDGLASTYEFANRTMKIYRKCFFTRKNGRKLFVHDKMYRRSYLESYVAFKRFCNDFDKIVDN